MPEVDITIDGQEILERLNGLEKKVKSASRSVIDKSATEVQRVLKNHVKENYTLKAKLRNEAFSKTRTTQNNMTAFVRIIGFDIWSGEHLNFVSESDPGIKQGQIVTAKIVKFTTQIGSWYLSYEVIDVSDGTSSKSEKQDLVLKDSGYTIVQGSYSTNIYYAVVIENPNTDYAVEYPKINIVCKSETGAILKAEEQVLNYIAAGDTLTYGNSFSCDEGEPSTVDVTVSNSEDNIELQSDSKYVKSSAFEIGNVSFFNDGMKATAEVKNTTSKDMDQIAVSVVFSQGGHVIGGYTGYVDDVSAGATKAAEINNYSSGSLKYDTVKLYACEW